MRFFLAEQPRDPLPDEVFLSCGDGYESLPEKVREVNRWALAHNFDKLLKLDDDIVMFPSRVTIPTCDYMGWSHDLASNWCSGLAYWLSRESMEAVAEADLTDQPSEDRWTGSVLLKAGIKLQPFRYGAVKWLGQRRRSNPKLEPLPRNLAHELRYTFVAGEFLPEEMALAYMG